MIPTKYEVLDPSGQLVASCIAGVQPYAAALRLNVQAQPQVEGKSKQLVAFRVTTTVGDATPPNHPNTLVIERLDESGTPVDDVYLRAMLPAAGVFELAGPLPLLKPAEGYRLTLESVDGDYNLLAAASIQAFIAVGA